MMNAPTDFLVAGKSVLITGGSGGIGNAFAEAFVRHGAGVATADLEAAALAAPQVPGIRRLVADVTDSGSIRKLADTVDRVDVLIHCAGMIAHQKEYEPATFGRVVDVHLTGIMRLIEAFGERLKAAKGCVILISSMHGYFGSARAPAYAAAKAGTISLTKSLALAMSAAGVRVNCIAPGWIETPISAKARENEAFNARLLERLPIGRWAKPDEIAAVAVFLASPAASLITGVTIPVDGGYSAS